MLDKILYVSDNIDTRWSVRQAFLPLFLQISRTVFPLLRHFFLIQNVLFYRLIEWVLLDQYTVVYIFFLLFFNCDLDWKAQGSLTNTSAVFP
jgi:hypothetical protein